MLLQRSITLIIILVTLFLNSFLIVNSEKDSEENNNLNNNSSSIEGYLENATSLEISPEIVRNSLKKTPKKFVVNHGTKLIIDKNQSNDWKCPNITITKSLDCGCDLPHTLRCSGDIHGLQILANNLRESTYKVSLLDCTLKNVTILSEARIFENVSLHGLVISSGELKRIHKSAFLGLSSQLQALGLPSNALTSVPSNSISSLISLERIDLSNNKIKSLGSMDFSSLKNLKYLELTTNQIQIISKLTFQNLKKLEILKLGSNRLGANPDSLSTIKQCTNLRQLDLNTNSINGPFTFATLPSIPSLESLNLERNLIKSIQNKAFKNFGQLKTLYLRSNQIDVLQDHAFFGLQNLEVLDLSYNGIVAISGASLKHLSKLRTLDLTNNFLRALTLDLISPLPSLIELHLAGNDISIVAKNALDDAKKLTSLSLQDNPFSCDCSITTFVEWLSIQKFPSNDLLSATCATPQYLEGAPLYQLKADTLSCDNNEDDGNIDVDGNENILGQLEQLSDMNSARIKDFSEMISLRDLHYSTDYGLILTWAVNLSKDDYLCDAIFVFREMDIHETLIDNSPIHCESKVINGQNTVSVIVPDSSSLEIGESYRFCLVLIQELNTQSDLLVGCSNTTKLQINEGLDFPWTNGRTTLDHHRVSSVEENNNSDKIIKLNNNLSSSQNHNSDFEKFNRNFLPGLGLGILVTSVFVLFWSIAKLRSNSHMSSTVTTWYSTTTTTPDRLQHMTDPESGNRYLKLQATTSL